MRERKEKSIDEILEISFKYLTEHGLENTSIRDLAKETDMSLGSIYYWFEDKEDFIVNAVKYGLIKSSTRIFEEAFDKINEFDSFIEHVMELAKEEQRSLQMVYQAATSPMFGDRIRKNAEPLNNTYMEYINLLSNSVNVPYEEIKPLVFLFIATLLDFVVWNDYEFSKKQLEYIYGLLQSKIEAAAIYTRLEANTN